MTRVVKGCNAGFCSDHSGRLTNCDVSRLTKRKHTPFMARLAPRGVALEAIEARGSPGVGTVQCMTRLVGVAVLLDHRAASPPVRTQDDVHMSTMLTAAFAWSMAIVATVPKQMSTRRARCPVLATARGCAAHNAGEVPGPVEGPERRGRRELDVHTLNYIKADRTCLLYTSPSPRD